MASASNVMMTGAQRRVGFVCLRALLVEVKSGGARIYIEQRSNKRIESCSRAEPLPKPVPTS